MTEHLDLAFIYAFGVTAMAITGYTLLRHAISR